MSKKWFAQVVTTKARINPPPDHVGLFSISIQYENIELANRTIQIIVHRDPKFSKVRVDVLHISSAKGRRDGRAFEIA